MDENGQEILCLRDKTTPTSTAGINVILVFTGDAADPSLQYVQDTSTKVNCWQTALKTMSWPNLQFQCKYQALQTSKPWSTSLYSKLLFLTWPIFPRQAQRRQIYRGVYKTKQPTKTITKQDNNQLNQQPAKTTSQDNQSRQQHTRQESNGGRNNIVLYLSIYIALLSALAFQKHMWWSRELQANGRHDLVYVKINKRPTRKHGGNRDNAIKDRNRQL